MNVDQILTDVFTDRAETRPDAHDVLTSVRQRLEQQRRVSVGQAAAVVGTAAAVAVTGVAAVAIAGLANHSHSAPGGTQSGGVAAASHPAVRAHSSTSPAPRATHPAALPKPRARGAHPAAKDDNYSTIAAGWLPGSSHEISASREPGFEERDYTAEVNGVDMDVIIYLESGTALPDRTEAGANPESLTINGHPAREFVADNATIVAFDLGNGEIAYAGPSVVATTGQVTTADITAIAVHVATDMQFDQHDPMPANQPGTQTFPLNSGKGPPEVRARR
jgi:hypothetical protein